ncbi:MAG: hypothetical protein WC886_08055 [Saccharofermentanaceae bacterium]|jgi:hypothetical protein
MRCKHCGGELPPDGYCICEEFEMCPVCGEQKENGQFCDNCDGRKMD